MDDDRERRREMTKEEILKMAAGEELNELVDRHIVHPLEEYPEWRLVKSFPGYSFDIGFAWQVVEKMRRDKSLLYRFGLALSEMSLNQQYKTRADYIADLMRWLCPEAICKAALLAKLEE
jgi:hypothetical protein